MLVWTQAFNLRVSLTLPSFMFLTVSMSDWADDEPVAAPVALAAAPEAPVADIKLFNKWNCNDVVVNDLSLKDYIAVMPKVWSQLQ